MPKSRLITLDFDDDSDNNSDNPQWKIGSGLRYVPLEHKHRLPRPKWARVTRMAFPAFIMSALISITLLLFLLLADGPRVGEARNNRPIIGILSQVEFENGAPANRSYIAASYVKFVEGAGARVVPILVDQPMEYYDQLFNSINGVLFPGGGSSLNESLYGIVGKIMYKKAVEAYDRGDYFPLWGTCLGFQLLTFLIANDSYLLNHCEANNFSLPLDISPDSYTSRLFGQIPSDVYNALVSKPVTPNFHHYCITPENFTNSLLGQRARILSVNNDLNGAPFVSTLEAIGYPFFGVQWHPEKSVYEWTTQEPFLPHLYEAVRVTQHFANFFVEQARLNDHKFSSEEEAQKWLIYNYAPVYTGLEGSTYEQKYRFQLNLTNILPSMRWGNFNLVED